jgi:hypothetical protein
LVAMDMRPYNASFSSFRPFIHFNCYQWHQTIVCMIGPV